MSAALNAEADSLQWQPVSSSDVASLAYNPTFRRAFARFKDGSVYAYHGMEPHVFDGWLKSGSKGKYLWIVIRNRGKDDRYAYQKI